MRAAPIKELFELTNYCQRLVEMVKELWPVLPAFLLSPAMPLGQEQQGCPAISFEREKN